MLDVPLRPRTLAEKGGEPREAMCARSQMKSARNSGLPLEKWSDWFERNALTMSALRLQILHIIPGYYGDQLKVFCISGRSTDVRYKGLNTDDPAGDLFLYFSDKLNQIAGTIADRLFFPPICQLEPVTSRLSMFPPVTMFEVVKLIESATGKISPLDIMQTSIMIALKEDVAVMTANVADIFFSTI